MAENMQELLDRLDDDEMRQVALGKLEGLTNKELAERLGISRRSVERKLGIIRGSWTPETSS